MLDSVTGCAVRKPSALHQREDSRNEFIQKSARSHEHNKVTALDGDERLTRGTNRVHETPGEARRRREVLSTLDHEDRHGEFATEALRVKRVRLRDEALAADALPIDPLVDVSQRISGRTKCKTEHGRNEEVRTFE